MKQLDKKKKGIFTKLVAGATAGATVGLATYMYFKTEKMGPKKVENPITLEDAKADLFV